MSVFSWIVDRFSKKPVPIDPNPVLPPAPAAPPPEADAFVISLLALHNRARQVAGAARLLMEPRLCRAAQAHAAWMAANRSVDHFEATGTVGFDGAAFTDRVRAHGYKFQAAGENIAAGQRTEGDVMAAWTSSPLHYRNMVSDAYRDVGFGRAADADGRVYWCAVFGTQAAGRSLTVTIPPALVTKG